MIHKTKHKYIATGKATATSVSKRGFSLSNKKKKLQQQQKEENYTQYLLLAIYDKAKV